MEPITLTINAASAALGLSRSKLYELIREGSLESVKVDGRRLVKTASIRAFIDSLPVAA
jgi:excisionase family DNA binding protein